MDLSKFWVGDTEDNSKELCEKQGHSLRGKRVLQIALLSSETGKNEQRILFEGTGCVEQFRGWLDQLESPVVIYFFNLQYDLGNLFPGELDLLAVTLVGSRMIEARFGNAVFRDAFNIWPLSVKKLGDVVGLEKLEMDLTDSRYVFRDCEIVRAAMLLALDKFGAKGFPATLGGLCVKAFQGMNLKNWYDCELQHKEAYYGGRVELFADTLKGAGFVIDINSLYPFAMLNEFPTGAEPIEIGAETFGVAEVTIKVPEQFITPLPMRYSKGGNYYPWGELRGVWTHHEIREAIEHHGAKIKRVHWSKGSESGESYYQPYVKRFYGLRLKSKTEGEKTFYKLLLNNLYGRLALGGVVTRAVELVSEDFTRDDLYCGDLIPFGRRALKDFSVDLPEFTNYLHAAYVTSYARIELLRWLRRIHNTPGFTLAYCDTDSIFALGDVEKLPLGNELGAMKLVCKTSVIQTFAPKCYRTDNDHKAKGVRKDKAKQFNETGKASFYSPFKYRESVRVYDAGNIKPLSSWRTVTKEKQTEYDKKKLTMNLYYPIIHA